MKYIFQYYKLYPLKSKYLIFENLKILNNPCNFTFFGLYFFYSLIYFLGLK